MATGIVINNLRNKFSENLINNSSFTEELTINKTSGSVISASQYSSEKFYVGSTCIKSYNDTIGTPLVYNFGSELGCVIPKTSNYIFSINIQHIDTTVFDNRLKVNIFVNGINTYNIDCSLVPDGTIGIQKDKWHTFAQSFTFTSGDVITFTFEHTVDATSITGVSTIYFDAIKLEADDRYLGVPTPYSYPNGYFSTSEQNIIYVSSLDDLPNASSGIINLEDEKTYYFTNAIDLNGDRLVGGSNTTILGSSSENSSITSTGLGTGIALLTSIYSTPIRHITFKDVHTAINFNGVTNPDDMALDWTGVNFLNVPNIGSITEASNFIYDKGAFLNSKGISFDGTIGTVGLGNCLFSGDGLAGDIILIESTCVIERRFRMIYSSVVAFGSTIGINVNSSSTIPVESYILDTVNFSGGSTYLAGVMVNDNKTAFVNCKGIQNSTEVSQYYMNNNATATVIASTSTPVKIAGTTTSASITQKFTNTNNRSTYNGSFVRVFYITATLSFDSGNNNQIGCYIAKNGTVLNESEVYGTTSGTGRAENVTIQTLVELSENDYIEVFVENATSSTNITVTDLNVIVQ